MKRVHDVRAGFGRLEGEVIEKVQSAKRKKGLGDMWTREEEDLFCEGLRAYGKDFTKIEEHVVSKTRKQIYNHAE